jgi:hypothetical protein
MYGTGTDEAADAAEMFVKIAEAQGYDLESMTDEEVLGTFMKVAEEAAADAAVEEAAMDLADAIKEKVEEEAGVAPAEAPVEAPPEAAPEEKMAEVQQEEPEWTEEFQEKIAEADFLGRVSAHAFVQEMDEMEKEAAGKGLKEFGEKGWVSLRRLLKGKASRGARSRKEQLKEMGQEAASAYRKGAKLPDKWVKGGRGGQEYLEAGGKSRLKGIGAALKTRGAAAGALTAAGLAGAGGAAYGGKKALSKKKKAAELIQDYINYMGQEEEPEQEKEAEADFDFNDVVLNRTAEILGEWGIG